MIYFIQCGENGPIKIGQTGDVEKRISQLQTGCPYELKLLWTYHGNSWKEEEVHEALEAENIRGEWFHPSSNVFDFMKEFMWNRTIVQSNYGPVIVREQFFRNTKLDKKKMGSNASPINVETEFAKIGFFAGNISYTKNPVYGEGLAI